MNIDALTQILTKLDSIEGKLDTIITNTTPAEEG